MNTRCPLKRVPSAARFFTRCELTVQPPQNYSVGGQRSSGQLTGKPAGARPDYRGRCNLTLNATIVMFCINRELIMSDNQILETPAAAYSKNGTDIVQPKGHDQPTSYTAIKPALGAPVLYSTSLGVLGASASLVPECFNTRLSSTLRWEPLSREQAQALALAPAQLIMPAPELTPLALVVAPDVTEPDFSIAEENHDAILSRPHGKVSPSFKSSPYLP
ncbi:UNVERIFIED_CONTAM: hypothetical protein FKN15_045428 [Acipenser sinensis]